MERMKAGLVALTLLAVVASAVAAPRVRVFVKQLEYVGPTIQANDEVLVDLERFASAVGWSARKQDNAWALAPHWRHARFQRAVRACS